MLPCTMSKEPEDQSRAKIGALISQEPATAPETDYSGFDIVKATQYGSLTRVKELVEGSYRKYVIISFYISIVKTTRLIIKHIL